MKLVLRRVLVCALLLVAGFGAQAQSDEVLERYGLALVNLSESMRTLSSDVATSRDELDRAAGALRFLATRAGNPSLVEAMERVFERARTAIVNRSSTDLAVQSSLLRGGFQRAVYDSGLAVLESEPATARARLERLANDLGFDEQTSEALAAAQDAESIRRLFEAAVADIIGEQLRSAEASFGESRDTAYRALADAYGNFLLIQDSPRASAQLNSDFARAADGLVGSRTEEMSEAIAALGLSFQNLAQAARAPVGEGSEAAAAEQPSGVAQEQAAGEQSGTEEQAVAGTPAAEGQSGEVGADTQTDEQSPVDRVTVVAGMPSAEQAPTTTATPPSTPGADPVAQPMPAGAAGEENAAPAEAADGSAAAETGPSEAEIAPSEDAAAPSGAAPQATSPQALAQGPAVGDPFATPVGQSLRALEAELTAAGVPATRAATMAARLGENGVASLTAAIDDLYSRSARVVAAVQAGEQANAERALAEFQTGYENQVQPVVAAVSPAVDRRVTALTDSLAGMPALRSQDALVLLGQVDAVARLLGGESASSVQIANAQTTLLWAGWVRAATLIVLALLAIVPLYLLNLAFGGGNRNWQLVGVALFLLLLPAIYEGLASIGALAAQFSGVEELALLVDFSMFQSPIAQVVWAAITAAAILFAIAGLYGICVQFGLIGAQRITPGDSQSLRSTAVVPDADTVVDWDEEF